MSEILPPFPLFTDVDGSPLENGYLYIGTVNLNPEVNPINVYWDAALTIPAAQPIRTINGYPARFGTPSMIHIDNPYSLTIKDKNQALVQSSLSNWLKSGLVARAIRALSASDSITAADAGKLLFYNSASAGSANLPAASTFKSGQAIAISNLGAGNLSVSRAGSDTIYARGAGSTTIVLYQGQSIILASDGVSGWIQLAGPELREKSDGINGYTISSDGLITQWGESVQTVTAGADVTIALNTPFLSNIYNIVVCNGDMSANTGSVGVSAGSTLTSIKCRTTTSGGFRINWRATGR